MIKINKFLQELPETEDRSRNKQQAIMDSCLNENVNLEET